VVDEIAEDEKLRVDFLKACLIKLGLQASQEESAVPSLSRLHLSSLNPADTSELVASLQEIISIQDGQEYIKDENDTFRLEKRSAWSLSSIVNVLPGVSIGKTDGTVDDMDRPHDFDTVVKRVVIHEEDHPAGKETPYFNHHSFFANLKHYQSTLKESDGVFGTHLLYGEVVTSTNTMLEKYVRLSYITSSF
jgi:biotin--protein ligase